VLIDNKFAVQCSPELGKPIADGLHRLRTQAARVSAEHGVHYRSSVHADLGPVPQPDGPGEEQLRIVVERLKEKQEDEMINNGSYGLINNVHDLMRVKPRNGRPMPDDLE